jgi:long-chain acyl-CoA synthetase
VKKLVEDIAVLRPTTFVGVPRVFHRIYDKIMQGINESPWPRKKLFYYAFQAKTDALRKGTSILLHSFRSPWLQQSYTAWC